GVDASRDEPADGARPQRHRQRDAAALREPVGHPRARADAVHHDAAHRRGAADRYGRAAPDLPLARLGSAARQVPGRPRALHAAPRADAALPADARLPRARRVGNGAQRLHRDVLDGRRVPGCRIVRVVAYRQPNRGRRVDVRHPVAALGDRLGRRFGRRHVGQGAAALVDHGAQRQLRQRRSRHEGHPLLREPDAPRAVPRLSLARSAAVEGMIRRLLDWGGYLGLGILLAAAILTFVYPLWMTRTRWWTLLGAGVLLVLASLLARVEDFRGLFGHRTTKYGANTAVAIALVLGVTVVVQAL